MPVDNNIQRMQRVLNNLINKDIAVVSYNEFLACMYIKKPYTHELLLSITEDNIQNRYQIHMESEAGFYLFYDIFPSAPKIEITNDNIIIDKIKFINTYLTGINYDCFIKSFDDFKYISRLHKDLNNIQNVSFDFCYEHNFICNLDGFNLNFIYEYIIDIDDEVVRYDSTLTFSNKRIANETFVIINDPVTLDFEICNILEKYGASKLGISVNELQLKDSVLISIVNID